MSKIEGVGKRNEANLIVVDDDYEDLDGKHSGVDVQINEDGSITLDGEADEDITLTLLTDADGFGSQAIMALGAADFGEDADGAYIAVYNGSTLEASSYEGETIFISSGATSHTVKLFIPAGAELDNVTVYPMLNYGVSAASYFKITK